MWAGFGDEGYDCLSISISWSSEEDQRANYVLGDLAKDSPDGYGAGVSESCHLLRFTGKSADFLYDSGRCLKSGVHRWGAHSTNCPSPDRALFSEQDPSALYIVMFGLMVSFLSIVPIFIRLKPRKQCLMFNRQDSNNRETNMPTDG